MPLPVYTVTSLRTGTSEDGLLELQLLYGKGRGGSIWFRLNRAQAIKLYHELEALLDEDAPLFVPIKTRAVE